MINPCSTAMFHSYVSLVEGGVVVYSSGTCNQTSWEISHNFMTKLSMNKDSAASHVWDLEGMQVIGNHHGNPSSVNEYPKNWMMISKEDNSPGGPVRMKLWSSLIPTFLGDGNRMWQKSCYLCFCSMGILDAGCSSRTGIGHVFIQFHGPYMYKMGPPT